MRRNAAHAYRFEAASPVTVTHPDGTTTTAPAYDQAQLHQIIEDGRRRRAQQRRTAGRTLTQPNTPPV